MKFKIAVCFFIANLIAMPEVQANTFVGNGGSAGDVELLVTKRQIVKAVSAISNEESGQLCKCSLRFKNHKECMFLKELKEEQLKICQAETKRIAPLVLDLISNNKVKFNWTNSNIIVKDGKTNVYADAVADYKKSLVTINKNNFLSIPQTQRQFLLMHEILHLIKFEGSYLGDNGVYKEFKGPQGSRAFINSVAASTVMSIDKKGLNFKYREAINRPKSYKKNWLKLGLNASHSLKNSSNPFYEKSRSGLGLEYKRFFDNNYGFVLGFKNLKISNDILNSSLVEEDLNSFYLGLSYRIFPFKNPLSAKGQSFLSFDAQIESFTSTYEVSDTFVNGKGKDHRIGWSIGAQYYFPVSFFWVVGGLGLSDREYRQDFLNLDYNSINVDVTLGVSHAF